MSKQVSPDGWFIAAVALMSAAAACWLRGWHDAHRHPMGGHICIRCQKKFRDLHEAGFKDDQLRDARPMYNRGEGSITRERGY